LSRLSRRAARLARHAVARPKRLSLVGARLRAIVLLAGIGLRLAPQPGGSQRAGAIEDRVGDRGQVRVDALEVADDVEVQRAGLDAGRPSPERAAPDGGVHRPRSTTMSQRAALAFGAPTM
jgi:hypothetical protein